MMDLKFLGRGAAFNPAEGNTSAYILERKKLFLIDCGESVFADLICKNILDTVNEVWIAISHFHSDHCASLGSLTLYCAERLGFKAHILLPSGDQRYAREIRQLLQIFGVSEDQIQFEDESAEMGFNAFSAVRFCPTRHAPGMVCYSLSFETQDGGVFYTADTATEEGIKAFLKEHPAFEHVYSEAIDARTHPVHLPLEKLAALFPEEQRSRVTVMHLNGPRCGEHAMALGFSVAQRA